MDIFYFNLIFFMHSRRAGAVLKVQDKNGILKSILYALADNMQLERIHSIFLKKIDFS